MNNNWIWLVLSAAIGFLSVMVGYLFVPLLIDGQIIRADILGSLGTWAGSIATVGTLVFLSYQHITNTKHQTHIIEEQNELLKLEKYDKHRNQFRMLLSDIESSESMPVHFHNKNLIYKQIFPNNGFSNCLLKIDHTNNSDFFISCEKIRRELIELDISIFNLKSKKPLKDAERILDLLIKMNDMLDVNIQLPLTFGTITRNNKYQFNLLNIKKNFDIIFDIVNTLRDFSGLKGVYVNYSGCTFSHTPFNNFRVNPLFIRLFFEKNNHYYFQLEMSILDIYEPINGLFSHLYRLTINSNKLQKYFPGLDIESMLNIYCINQFILDENKSISTLYTEIEQVYTIYNDLEYYDGIPDNIWREYGNDLAQLTNFKNRLNRMIHT
ncbi:hypothetical protein A6D98_06175 [Aliivibrio fischeri]|uniref:hypothetical protein n=1 Tax=Aliivibrio fischeri TaxID=668 RepID=UPI00080E743F|nr:hypothetical protein [Aliivibrio fischeri]OCH05872.1 hypothetical protein A6E10_07345 [Aliivibrio fischeri]OCH27438.1 hypothetical protein A6E13_06740 [Aliivibrio fischeri]OCH62586.1 hypothetical protein A6D98_06175 [Aliivibrio fischeri]